MDGKRDVRAGREQAQRLQKTIRPDIPPVSIPPRPDYFYFTDETGAGYVFCTDGSGTLAPLLEPDLPIEEPPLITKLMYHHNIHFATILYMR